GGRLVGQGLELQGHRTVVPRAAAAAGGQGQAGGREACGDEHSTRLHGSTFRRVGGHPLTAPAMRPPVSFLCMIEKKTMLGIAASTEPAARGPSATLPSPPRKVDGVMGRAECSGEWSSTRAKKNSFHEETKLNSAAATTPGASSGKTMRRSTSRRLAPSIDPASSSSTGMPATYPCSIHSANGR